MFDSMHAIVHFTEKRLQCSVFLLTKWIHDILTKKGSCGCCSKLLRAGQQIAMLYGVPKFKRSTGKNYKSDIINYTINILLVMN